MQQTSFLRSRKVHERQTNTIRGPYLTLELTALYSAARWYTPRRDIQIIIKLQKNY